MTHPNEPTNHGTTEPEVPQSRAEWQAAVDSAHALIALHSAQLYGLVAGGFNVNVERCEWMIAQGAQRGIVPSPNAVDQFVEDLGLAGMLAPPHPTPM